jgi:hypothetical protein
VTKSNKSNSRTGRSFEEYGGDDETRTRDLCRDTLTGLLMEGVSLRTFMETETSGLNADVTSTYQIAFAVI